MGNTFREVEFEVTSCMRKKFLQTRVLMRRLYPFTNARLPFSSSSNQCELLWPSFEDYSAGNAILCFESSGSKLYRLFDKEEDTSFLGEQLGARRIREIYGFYCEDLLYMSWSTPRVSYWQITLLLQELCSFYKCNSVEIGMRDRIHGTFMANLSESFSPFLGKAAP